MKQPARVSPFAARTSQEQKEQWIVWQSQQDATRPVTQPFEPSNFLLDIDRPVNAGASQPIHHSQYDAVIRRITTAQRRTAAFVDARQPNQPTDRE